MFSAVTTDSLPKKAPLKRKPEGGDNFEHGGIGYDYPLGSAVEFVIEEYLSEVGPQIGVVAAVKLGEWVDVSRGKNGCIRVPPQFVRPRNKRSKTECIIPPWVTISAEYMGLDASWVDWHVLDRTWMSHNGEISSPLQNENDRRLIDRIKQYFCHNLSAEWMWPKQFVFTGSAILALAHGLDPFRCEWNCSDIDIFTRSFGNGTDELFGIDWFGKGRHVHAPVRGTVTLKTGTLASRIDLTYSKYVGKYMQTRKYTGTEYPNITLNVTQIKESKKNDQKMSEKKMKEEGKDGEYVSGGAIEEGESLHQYCLRCFDLDVLCMTFDGNDLKIGDGTMAARDRLASLTASYQIDPTKVPSRAAERCEKYLRRGVSIVNLPKVHRSLADFETSLLKNAQMRSAPLK